MALNHKVFKSFFWLIIISFFFYLFKKYLVNIVKMLPEKKYFKLNLTFLNNSHVIENGK